MCLSYSASASMRRARLLVLLALLAVLAACASPLAPTPTAVSAPAPTMQSTVPAPEVAAATIQPAAVPTQAQAVATTQPPPKGPRLGARLAENTTLATFTTAQFAGAGLCAACHAPLKDETGLDVAMPDHWRSTMMANASKDPLWQAKVSSEVTRNPDLQAVIEQKCVHCHMPMAASQAQTDGSDEAMFDDGFLAVTNPLHEAAMDGVSCTLCHQIQDQDLGQKASFSGNYAVDATTARPDRALFGPFADPVGQMMRASTGFDPVQGLQMTKAEFCATCHNLYTPYVDAAGNVLGEFPEQTPYTEWQHSIFGATGVVCQDCHMPKATGGVTISTVPQRGLPARQPFFQHFFAGGNVLMLTILRDNGVDLAVTADPAQFNATIVRTQNQLANAAMLSLKNFKQEDNTLTAQLQVSAATGHKFPSSFPSRRAWLHVTVTDAAGQVVFESGQPQPDGTIIGNDADLDPTVFERHYDIITAADQVQIYEPIMGNSDGQVTYTLLRAGQYLKDNRLLPAGFDKANAPADIAVYGQAATDENFLGGSDLVTYLVDVGQATGPFTLQAELLYQPISHQFVQDLLTDGTDLTNRFGQFYAPADKMPSRVAAIQAVTSE